MRAMRNVLIHEYFFVELKVVRATIKNDLPQLKQQIDDMLNEQQCGPRRRPDKSST